MLEWLKTILGDAYTEEIDKKVSKEIGKNFVARKDFNVLNAEKKRLAEAVKERDRLLENLKVSAGVVDDLKMQIAALQTENENAAKAYEKELKTIKVDTAVELALSAAKARNIKAVKALIDLEKAELDDDGTVKGLADQIKELTEAADSSFMFENKTSKKNRKDLSPGEGVTLHCDRYGFAISEEGLQRIVSSVLEKIVLQKLKEVCDGGN